MAEQPSATTTAPAEVTLPPGYTYASITDKIANIVLTRRSRWPWYLTFGIALLWMLAFFFACGVLFLLGPGIWGIDIPVAWGFAIGNFVWWIGIGHAGTFISAILLLLRQKWRTSINRFAEAMTLFAAGIAGIFPILHLGRPWFFYWLVPYPDAMSLWPQWRSPLVWDFFAISTYLTVSLVFWYIGLIPDLGDLAGSRQDTHAAARVWTVRTRLAGRGAPLGPTSERVSALAGLATPLVVSVHSIVSLDFAIGNTPGYHSTIFPPYFVAGALFSGFAMVLTLAIPLRHFFALHDLITLRHLENCAKVLLATSLFVTYGYLAETFMAYYSDDEFEIYMVEQPHGGPVCPDLLGTHCLQRARTPDRVVAGRAAQRAGAVRSEPGGEHGHVDGALSHRGLQPAPRLSALVVGNVLFRHVGIGPTCWALSVSSWSSSCCSYVFCRRSRSRRSARCCMRKKGR